MQKKKAARLAGFVGALCASGALVGLTVSSTGAYFTDSHTGAINTGTGSVKVNTSSLALNYSDLLPGTYKSQTVDYQAAGTGPEDIWLVVPTDGSANALGVPANSDSLGRYGHFQVDSNAGSFVSNNLSGGDASTCPVDANGHGGDADVASFAHQGDGTSGLSALPYCAPVHAILLDSNLTAGHGGTATITFGYTRILRSGAGAPLAQTANFKIVATQAGIRPDDTNNPAGTVANH
ncbi:MAG TPA: hypothetical protein VIG48_03415 [Jatrophihabitans sp.]|jgi:hypothetical protein